MAPPIFGALKLPLGQPINVKWLGAHKTYRGFYAGYLGALGVLYLQQYFEATGGFHGYGLFDYGSVNIWFYAFLFGFGAIFGDAVKSFFKRLIGKKEGSVWFPFDQLDFVVMVVIFTYPFVPLDQQNILVLLILTPLLHFLTNVAAYLLGLKEVWW